MTASPRAIVAIPVHNEAQRIWRCLSALATQRDEAGSPLAAGSFSILVFANNCTDGTVERVGEFARLSPHPIILNAAELPPERQSAGDARKCAMDQAAARLTSQGAEDGVILTTDADSCVAPTWFSKTMTEMSGGADCVAGYIDAEPLEILQLGEDFLKRSRLEDTYLRLIAEIDARCDPRPHDPWPNHRVSSGASLAVTLNAYRAIGGLPARPVGEDAALTAALDRAGFKVRHSMAVSVLTSCRLDGRAVGGAAETMRRRHAEPDAPCDDHLEPALDATRRAIYRGRLRRQFQNQSGLSKVAPEWRMPKAALWQLNGAGTSFEEAWEQVKGSTLPRGVPLRPSDLPRQIAIANMILTQLRRPLSAAPAAPVGTPRREPGFESAA
ncbi:glycosyltransferase family 2 protein [Rhodopseudomonas palustris]|uniref:Glycosyltransferase family 2 protein n=1 Tax=Rhodopseudomonas palustris TaxID=1076 RepID=A0A323UJN7_RHOPL|nr:glycosyltransferase family 2 protein [Rhodopseudomonas palustris]